VQVFFRDSNEGDGQFIFVLLNLFFQCIPDIWRIEFCGSLFGISSRIVKIYTTDVFCIAQGIVCVASSS
jgi:hypothetical protein